MREPQLHALQHARAQAVTPSAGELSLETLAAQTEITVEYSDANPSGARVRKKSRENPQLEAAAEAAAETAGKKAEEAAAKLDELAVPSEPLTVDVVQ